MSTTPIISSTQNCNYSLRYWSYFLRSYLPLTWPAWPRWREAAAPVPEAVVTVLCAPDDGCGWHPKHVEWTCRIINGLLCVASRWTVIKIDRCYFFPPSSGNVATHVVVVTGTNRFIFAVWIFIHTFEIRTAHFLCFASPSNVSRKYIVYQYVSFYCP